MPPVDESPSVGDPGHVAHHAAIAQGVNAIPAAIAAAIAADESVVDAATAAVAARVAAEDLLTGTAASGTYPPITLGVYDDFTGKSNGAVGTAQTGQAYLTTGNGTPLVASGKYVSSTDGTAYIQADAGSDVTQIGAEVTIESGTAGPVFALIVGASGSGIQANLDNCLHVIVRKDAWTIQKRMSGVSTSLASGLLALTADGATKHQYEVDYDDASATATLAINGQVVGAATDADLRALTGRYCIWEPTKTTGSEEPRATRIWAYGSSSSTRRAPWSRLSGAAKIFLDHIRTDSTGADLVGRRGLATQTDIGSTPAGLAGVTFGSARDTQLYRAAANSIGTPGTLIAQNGTASQVTIGTVQSQPGVWLGNGFDTRVRRAAAGIVALGKLAVGNSAAATTPGSVSKKIEVYDESGVSLGFVPVYAAIT